MLRRFKPYRRLAGGPKHRINLVRALINDLIKYERLEITYGLAHETQKYAERLVNVAKKGDKDPAAMKLADFWLFEKELVHKLFKVLVPRYENLPLGPYTRLLKVAGYNDHGFPTAFIEYKDNPYPPLRQEKQKNPDWIVNQLIHGAMTDLNDLGTLRQVGLNSYLTEQVISKSPSSEDHLQHAFRQGTAV